MTESIVTVTIEYANGKVVFQTYRRQGSIKALKAAIRAKLAADATIVHVGYGNGITQNSYGAH